MKVYLVRLYDERDDSDTLIGIYSTLDKAQRCKNEILLTISPQESCWIEIEPVQ